MGYLNAKQLFIWRSLSWSESGGACGRGIWSESGGVRGTASLGSGTFSSYVVGCDATLVVVGAFSEEEETVDEVEGEPAESAQLLH